MSSCPPGVVGILNAIVATVNIIFVSITLLAKRNKIIVGVSHKGNPEGRAFGEAGVFVYFGIAGFSDYWAAAVILYLLVRNHSEEIRQVVETLL